ncbi:transcription antitermination factor NusB [Marinospirillum sp. MEB164]|uniref:Transcription antitermination protein NusB n=1 Tax=Marinospirillum alkalitolerans TaxID=3123374 RepID=A0ABW8PTU6_9GAMM
MTAAKKKPSRSQARSAARQLTLQALYQWQISGNPMHQVEAAIRASVPDDGLEPHEEITLVLQRADLAYFHELAQQIPQKVQELDNSYSHFLDRRLEELDPVELALLRLAAYELIFRLDVPYRVIINESVELAKRFGATASHKYINGIVDKLAQHQRRAEIQAKRQSQ